MTIWVDLALCKSIFSLNTLLDVVKNSHEVTKGTAVTINNLDSNPRPMCVFFGVFALVFFNSQTHTDPWSAEVFLFFFFFFSC